MHKKASLLFSENLLPNIIVSKENQQFYVMQILEVHKYLYKKALSFIPYYECFNGQRELCQGSQFKLPNKLNDGTE